VRQMEVQVEGMHQLDATNNIVSDGANVNSHGTVFTHTFVAAGPTAEVVIDGAYLQQRDIFPAVNAVTLESLTEPAAAPHSGTTTLGAFTGGEVGEGLDLDGTFLYAVNVGGPDTPTIRDVTFDSNNTGAAPYAIDTPPGVGIWALNHIPGWYATVDYGAAPEDDALESMMDDIRWSNNPDTVSVVLEELTVGQAYKLQLLFDEAATAPNRSFDVFVEGQLAIDNLNTGTSLDGTGVVMTHEFVATDDTLTVVLDGTRGNTSDLNPILQGFTLEVVPEPASLTLLLVGLIGLLRMRNRK